MCKVPFVHCSIDHMSEVMRDGIESSSKIQEALVLEQAAFLLNEVCNTALKFT